jgi:hypothetical protein
VVVRGGRGWGEGVRGRQRRGGVRARAASAREAPQGGKRGRTSVFARRTAQEALGLAADRAQACKGSSRRVRGDARGGRARNENTGRGAEGGGESTASSEGGPSFPPPPARAPRTGRVRVTEDVPVAPPRPECGSGGSGGRSGGRTQRRVGTASWRKHGGKVSVTRLEKTGLSVPWARLCVTGCVCRKRLLEARNAVCCVCFAWLCGCVGVWSTATGRGGAGRLEEEASRTSRPSRSAPSPPPVLRRSTRPRQPACISSRAPSGRARGAA